MTLPLTIALLALWSLAMFRYGRSVLFPPASLGIVWTITLFAIWLCGDVYFPLTTTANEIVLAGVLSFSAGRNLRRRSSLMERAITDRGPSHAAYAGRPMADHRSAYSSC